jgi:hypothetical protein
VLAKQVLSQLSYTPTAEAILILKHFLPFRNPVLRIFVIHGVNPCFETVFCGRPSDGMVTKPWLKARTVSCAWCGDSWAAGIDDPEFWNSKLRAPICFNPPAARFNVPLTIKKTDLVLAGRSKTQVFDAIKTAFDKKELQELESGAMCYMLSKQGYLSDRDGHWHPHLMFFAPLTEPTVWGAGLPGCPVIGVKDMEERFTLFLVPVTKWSDGTPAATDDH